MRYTAFPEEAGNLKFLKRSCGSFLELFGNVGISCSCEPSIEQIANDVLGFEAFGTLFAGKFHINSSLSCINQSL